jgi:hypothetical protein
MRYHQQVPDPPGEADQMNVSTNRSSDVRRNESPPTRFINPAQVHLRSRTEDAAAIRQRA